MIKTIRTDISNKNIENNNVNLHQIPIDNFDSHKPIQKQINDFLLLESLGSGSFGELYLAYYFKTKSKVAIKFEEKNKDKKDIQVRLFNEYNIYKTLHKAGFGHGLPKVYDYVESPDRGGMIMELLGDDLYKLSTKYGTFQLATVFKIAHQILYLIQKMHVIGYLHRDIKPNNFIIGLNDKDQIYIMDFGLSKQYMKDGVHTKWGKQNFVGTARYVSINMHTGIRPSRRDDLESIGYMLIYFLKGSLPWQGIKKKKNTNYLEMIGDKKMCTSVSTLCSGIPDCFVKYIEYCRNLKYDETPNYDYLRRLFNTSARTLKITPAFEWLN